jgi:hypothetical protein
MPKRDDEPASFRTSLQNLYRMYRAGDSAVEGNYPKAVKITGDLRKELESKGLKGFKRGGKVKKTGVYKLHKGEKVVTAKAAAKKPVAHKGRR